MSTNLPPLGPGQGNVTNIDGTALSYFQRSDKQLTGACTSVVYTSLLSSVMAHETTMHQFTDALNDCTFFVQGYDNSKIVCFGAIRILKTSDLNILNQFYGGFGVDPFGYSGYGGGYSYLDIFGEVDYVWEDPTYAGDSLSQTVVDLLLNAQRDFVDPPNSRRLLCVVPTSIPSGTQYDWVRYLTSSTLAGKGVTVTTQGNANTGTIPYHNVSVPSTLMNLVQ